MRNVLLATFAAVLFSGCLFQHLAPTEQLTETVQQFNDDSRWGRVDLSSERVAGTYRALYLFSHQRWGGEIQIADTELTNLTISEDATEATARVMVNWYDMRTMEVYTTILNQSWSLSGDGYFMEEEEILGGSEELLTFPEEESEEEAEELASLDN